MSGAEVFIANTRRMRPTSSVNGRQYVVTVARPFDPPPPAGYRTLYVLDAYWYFASAVEAVRSYREARDAVVVGIGYPDDQAWVDLTLTRHAPLPASFDGAPPARVACSLERLRDLTLPADEDTLVAESIPGFAKSRVGDVGGLDDFLQVIEREVKPRVARLVPIDHTSQAIFGHSLGGLAVLHALFTAPASFRTFIASSPAIWWNRKAVLAGEEDFAAAVEMGSVQPRVLITVGGEEEVPPELPASLGVDQAEFEMRIRSARMIENARALATRLKSLKGSGMYRVEGCDVFDRVGHTLAPWSSLGRAVAFAFSPDR